MKLLVVDRDRETLEAIAAGFEEGELRLLSAEDAESALSRVTSEQPQIVLLDPAVAGMDFIDRVLECDPGVTLFVISRQYAVEAAVDAIRRGAHDYLSKPLCLDRLREHVEKWQAEAGNGGAPSSSINSSCGPTSSKVWLAAARSCSTCILASAGFHRISARCWSQAIPGPARKLVAKALHRLSPKSSGPFVVCNSTAIVETLFESELFGYVKGAFTGASQDRAGLFEFAHGGTLFLDEIGELPIAAQAKLLRVLQNQEVQRVGSPAVRKVDVRVVAATNRDLRVMVAQKQFRDDLYYRLSMVEVHLPRLVTRKEDLPLLERHFIEAFAAKYQKPVRGITRRAQALLARYSWPGNVRELENILGYACMMADREAIDIRDFPERLRTQAAETTPVNETMLPLDEVDRRHARKVLEQVGGNRVRAAEILGISRATLYRLLPKNGHHALTA